MDKSLMNEYLTGAGMEMKQAHALSQLLGQMATREDLGILRAEMNGRFAQIDERLTSMQLQVDTRLQGIEGKMDRKLEAFQSSVRAELQGARVEIHDFESRLAWRIIGAMVAMTAIFSAVLAMAV